MILAFYVLSMHYCYHSHVHAFFHENTRIMATSLCMLVYLCMFMLMSYFLLKIIYGMHSITFVGIMILICMFMHFPYFDYNHTTMHYVKSMYFHVEKVFLHEIHMRCYCFIFVEKKCLRMNF